MTSEVLFVQFRYWSELYDAQILCNGFSSVHESCKNAGDFYWVDCTKDQSLPITKGKVYVSAYYHLCVFQAISWSYQYPNVKFLVGGPAVVVNPTQKGYVFTEPLRSNIEFSPEIAEEAIFGQSLRNSSWDIDLPGSKSGTYCVNFTNEVGCYWNKCTFCGCYDDRAFFHNSVADLKLDSSKKWIVWFGTAALSPGYILKEFRKLNPAIVYHTHARADVSTLNALKNELGHCKAKLVFHIGVECPSDHMLEHMNKGTSVKTIVEMISLIYSYGHSIAATFIVGWKALQESDLKEIEKFCSYVGNLADIRAHVNWLICQEGSPVIINETSSLRRDSKYQRRVTFSELNEKQIKLNLKAESLYKKYFNAVIRYRKEWIKPI